MFLAACGLVAWATFAAVTGRIPIWACMLYLVALTGSAIAAYDTTFHYTYLANANTRIHGWPVPTVVFQRDGPNEPWLDFVGPTVVLAYPMNVVLYAFIPALVVWAVFRFCKRSQMLTVDTPPASKDGPQNSEQVYVDTGNPYQSPLTPK